MVPLSPSLTGPVPEYRISKTRGYHSEPYESSRPERGYLMFDLSIQVIISGKHYTGRKMNTRLTTEVNGERIGMVRCGTHFEPVCLGVGECVIRT